MFILILTFKKMCENYFPSGCCCLYIGVKFSEGFSMVLFGVEEICAAHTRGDLDDRNLLHGLKQLLFAFGKDCRVFPD